MNETLFKGSVVKLKGSRVSENNQAPNFILTTNELEDVLLDNFTGRKKVIYTAPSLDTPVCLTSSKKLGDLAKNQADYAFIIITADLPFAQKRICGIENIQNITTLSMMRDKNFGVSYGLLIDDGPLRGLLARCVLVLDEKDKIIYMELTEDITHEPNYERLQAALV